MKTIKMITFFALAPIYVFSMVFAVIGGDGKEGKGWFQEIWDKPMSLEKVVAIFIAPFIFTNMYFLRFTEEAWEELLD